MADPPVPAPWTPTPAPTPPNEWSVPPEFGQWDPRTILAKLEADNAALIRDAFGEEIPLMTLVELLARYTARSCSDEELIRLINMGIYFAEHKMQWPEAAANLKYWLVAGMDPVPQRRMKHELIKNRSSTIDTCCGRYFDLVVAGVETRLKATPGTLFPSVSTTVTGPSGEPIVLTPAASPLAAGGEDTIYIEDAVDPTESSTEDIYNAVGGVVIVAKVKVKSEKVEPSGWRVTITDWECWFWDKYDWGFAGQSVTIPLNLSTRLQISSETKAWLQSLFNIDITAYDNLKIADSTMAQIEDKQINMPDGTQARPKAYQIYGDTTWRFDPAAAPCSRETTWLVQ